MISMKLLNKASVFLKRNSSTILTVIGAVGTVATAVIAVKDTPKALKLIEEAKQEKGDELTKWEVVKVAGPTYIPAASVGVATIACIVGSNILSNRRQAALISAYTFLDKKHRAYRAKVNEVYGEDADATVQKELSMDDYEESIDRLEDPEKKLFYDMFSRQYFESTEEDVKNAQYLINRSLSIRGYASAKEYYDFLGIPSVDGGEELGWSAGMNMDYYWQEWIDFHHQYTIMEDGLECCIVYMQQEPNLEWQNY